MSPLRDQPIDHTMSFGDHLEELRRRVLWALVFPLPAAIILFFFSDTLIQWLLLPLYRVLSENHIPPALVVLTPQEMIFTQVKLSIIFALILSAPWVLWQVWQFIAPGLYQHERRFIHLLIPGSAVLTTAGLALMYFLLLPITLHVLVRIGQGVTLNAPNEAIDPRLEPMLSNGIALTVVSKRPESLQAGQAFIVWPDFTKAYVGLAASNGTVDVVHLPFPARGTVTQQYRVSETLTFILLMFLGIAIAFQMPLVVVLLGWLGLASTLWLRKRRKYALFICGVVAAVITPSADLISMLIMMIPLYGLYELGILLLILAPASAVAEGRVLSLTRWRSSADNRREPLDQPTQPAQSNLTVPRRTAAHEQSRQLTDGGEDSP